MISLLWLTLAASAAPPPLELTLDQAMALAAGRASVHAADQRARAAQAEVGTALLAAVGPRVGGSMTTIERTEAIAIDTPIGPFVQQPKRLVEGGVTGELPVDLALLIGGVPAARASARASAHLATRERELAQLAAGEALLDVVVIDARRNALDVLSRSLGRALAQVDALVEVGTALPSDRLRVEVALAEAEVGKIQLAASREAAVRALAWRVGIDAPPDVAFAWTPPAPPPPIERAIEGAEGRGDLRALEEQGSATAHLARAAALEGLPTIGVYGRVVATDNEVLVANRWVEGGVQIAWTPVAGGTRIARNRALAAQGRAVRADLDDARGGLRAELEAARAAVLGGLAEVGARELALTLAREAERMVAERFGQGLATLTDTLAAAASRADLEAAVQVARVDATRASLRWRAASGELAR